MSVEPDTRTPSINSSRDNSIATSTDDLGILEILVVLAKHRKLVVVLPFVSAILAAAISLAIPNTYTGTAKILPPQPSGSPITAVLMGDSSAIGSASAVGQALGLKNPSDVYVGMLQSRTITDAVMYRFDLQTLYEKKTLVETRSRINEILRITPSHDGIITIEADDSDPLRAANLANAFVEELDKLTQTVAVTSAGRQRVFLEKQMHRAKDQLAEAEVALRETQEKTGLISVTEQGKAMIESVANLRALIATKRVQLAAMRASSTEHNPDYVRAQQELHGLTHELIKLEKKSPLDSAAVIPSAGQIPGAGLQYVRKLREVQYQQTLFELLAKQFEIARSQEAAEGGFIQILDRAVPPDRKSGPNRIAIVLVTAFLALILGTFVAFALEALTLMEGDPRKAGLVAEINRHLPIWFRKIER